MARAPQQRRREDPLLQPRLRFTHQAPFAWTEPIASVSPTIRQSSLHSAMLPMTGPERRRTPRTTVERFVYINLEPSNGGSVLNVSEGGLCFHSIAPIQATRTIRFWFWEHNRRIEVEGELVWTDETRKTGALRFTTLPPDAREPIRNWVTPLAARVAADEAPVQSISPWRLFAPSRDSRPGTNTASTMPEPPARVSLGIAVPKVLKGFSGGLATGLLVSALVTAGFLFHGYRRQFGETLIQLGERLATRPQAQTQPVSPAPPSPSPAAPTVFPVQRTQSTAPAPAMVVRRSEKVEMRSLAQPPERQQLKFEPAHPPKPQQSGRQTFKPATATPAVGPAPKALVAFGTAAISSTRSTTPLSLPASAVAPPSNVISGKPRSIPKLEPENHPGIRTEHLSEETSRSSPGIYLEVGKFKDAGGAQRASDKLTQLGFHATVVQKGRLWTNSYFVLVGPYADDRAEGARKGLASHGFKTRAFESGSRTLTVYGGCETISRLLRSGPNQKGVEMPVGDCVISWESYSTRAIVKFVQDDYVIATAGGRWVNRNLRFQRDAFVYRNNDDGSQTLIEIQFAGLSQALVFDKTS